MVRTNPLLGTGTPNNHCPLTSHYVIRSLHQNASDHRSNRKAIFPMDVLLPCSSFRSINWKPESNRRFCSPNGNRSISDFLKCRRRTTSTELQATVDVPGRTDNGSASIPAHKVTVHDRERGVVHEFLVPEDQYILHTAEAQNISLPFACRHGCCTSCAVRIKSGQIRQPEALGISAELKSKGYALLCVGFPTSDVEVETQDEDEVYWLQFGRYFARGPIERDDYALELALADE